MPVMGEMEYLPSVLPSVLKAAEGVDFEMFICVNQPEAFRDDVDRKSIYRDNQSCLNYLQALDDPRICILDYSSAGKGWQGKKHGVGHARRVAMDAAVAKADANDLLVSMDADTLIPENYFCNLLRLQKQYPDAVAMALPYYHPLTGNEAEDRAVLRYELYMRFYSLNLWRTESPYRFTALGSAMACPVKSYRRIGGITPKMSGEDFYFLQKLRKSGPLLVYSTEKVYPASRFSARVFFGTGPAMIKGNSGDWSSYPFYDPLFFDEIQNFYDLLPKLYRDDCEGRVLDFLKESNKGRAIWRVWRANAASEQAFIKAAHTAFDGLRILQYLRWRKEQQPETTEMQTIRSWVQKFYPHIGQALPELFRIDALQNADTALLNVLRDTLVLEEEKLQKACPLI